jgi:putative ABC transport system permease protein
MTTLRLAYHSLLNRKLTTLLTVLVIALCVALLIGVSQVRHGARESFAGVISGTDLIVGPKGGGTQLLLYTVFHLGSPTANTSYAAYRNVADHPAVAWTIPLSLGDSHRGFRVVATNQDFYRHYRHHGDNAVSLAQGNFPSNLWDVAIGSEAAEALGYALGQAVVVTHGVSSTGILEHKDKPFTLVGILAQTGTPVDQSVFVTLEGFEAMHIDWKSGAPPRPGEAIPAADIKAEDIRVKEITAFLVGTRSRMDALGLQREINTAADGELMAVLPGVTLSELWRIVGYAENALLLVSGFVVCVGLLGMLITLYTALDARRREMAILRALGSGARMITTLLVLEALLLSFTGCLIGVGIVYLLQWLLTPFIRAELGLYLPIRPLAGEEWLFLAVVIGAGMLMAIPPAMKAYRNALSDGLATRL